MFALNSINWYLTKTNKAIDKISKIPLGEDADELRFQYSSLIESMFSTIDYVIDDESIPADRAYINNEIKNNLGVEGDLILSYMREVRNSVVHRGLDISARCDVVNGKLTPRAPKHITNKDGIQKKNPSETNLDILLFNLDLAIKKMVRNQLTTLGLLTKNDEGKIDMIALNIKTLSLPDDVPVFAKTMLAEWQKNLDMNTAKQHASAIQSSVIDGLEKNLNTFMDIRHLP